MLWWPPTIKSFSLLLHNCKFTTVINYDVNIWYARYLISDLCGRGHLTSKGVAIHRLRTAAPVDYSDWFTHLHVCVTYIHLENFLPSARLLTVSLQASSCLSAAQRKSLMAEANLNRARWEDCIEESESQLEPHLTAAYSQTNPRLGFLIT